VHLTNYSINKKSKKAQGPGTCEGGSSELPANADDGGGQALKWSLKQLRQHLESDRGCHAWLDVWKQASALLGTVQRSCSCKDWLA
jgi:hypothetical protein